MLIHCSNGGDPLAIKDILRGAGILAPLGARNDNVPWAPPERESRPLDKHAVRLSSGQNIVATFDFVDEHGEILYRKHRIEPGYEGRSKSFAYDRPTSEGGWQSGAGENRVPYRLPDLISAPRGMAIFMAEGEAKADKLASWGMLATSFKDWRDFDYSGYVKGRRVFILPDKDKAGETQAQRAFGAIERAEGLPRLIHLPGLPDGGDILDWAGSANDLRRLIEDADGEALIDLDDTSDWLEVDVPPRRWLLEDWFPIAEGALWTGAGAVGKSLSTQQLAVCVATGTPFLGAAVTQAPSIYISCEDSKEELQRRFQAIVKQLGAPVRPGQCKMQSWKGELDLELAVFDKDRRMRPTKRWESLRRAVLACGARLVVLDNTSHLFGGDENVKREVAAFANLLNGLSAEIDGVVLILGHPNKTGLNSPGAGDANQFGGSVGWENQFRSRAFQSAPNPEDPDYRELSNPKANYSPKGNKIGFRWWQGAFVHEDQVPEDFSKELTESIQVQRENEIFLSCLRARMANPGREVGPNLGPNYAPARFAEMTEAKGLSKPKLARALERLLHVGKIKTEEVKRKGSSTKTIIVEAS
ncbi:AAA family ATPase [Qipengyuania sp.]|uniref:AAA family ATPase n=1 Tax=Qipengyuania sp. TaxID=2004515 RepID=UPI003001A622